MEDNSFPLKQYMGKILIDQKDNGGHGNFKVWIKENFKFSHATATKYMEFYRNRKILKVNHINFSSEAYNFIQEVKMENGTAQGSKHKELTPEKKLKTVIDDISILFGDMKTVKKILSKVSDNKLHDEFKRMAAKLIKELDELLEEILEKKAAA